MDHRVPNPNSVLARQQTHRKRSFPGINPRKRDRHDLICVVCHAPAMGMSIFSIRSFILTEEFWFSYPGYNFDQITCESCKAFFRRNALNNAVRQIRFQLIDLFQLVFFSMISRTNSNVVRIRTIVLLHWTHEKSVKRKHIEQFSIWLTSSICSSFIFRDAKLVD